MTQTPIAPGLTRGDSIAKLTSEDPAFAVKLTVAPNGCWEWTGMVTDKGYGKVHRRHLRSAPILAHRLSWFLLRGAWPADLLLHRCDNPPCCNPGHLFEGDFIDNNRDMFGKGRGSNPPRHPADLAWLCEHPDVPENRTERATGRFRCRTCYNLYQRAWRAANRGTAAA